MAAPAATLELLLEEVRSLRREVAELRRGAGRPGSNADFLTKRAAARLLGVDRCTTLEQLLASGRIHSVLIAGRLRIPRAELQRIAAEGALPPPARPTRRGSIAAPAPAPGSLRRLRLADL
jgi:hypothetical protein